VDPGLHETVADEFLQHHHLSGKHCDCYLGYLFCCVGHQIGLRTRCSSIVQLSEPARRIGLMVLAFAGAFGFEGTDQGISVLVNIQ